MNSNTCSFYESANAYLDYLGDRADMASEAWESVEALFKRVTETKEFMSFAAVLKWYYSNFNDENIASDLYDLFAEFGALR